MLKLYVWAQTWLWSLEDVWNASGTELYKLYQDFVLFLFRVQYDPDYFVRGTNA